MAGKLNNVQNFNVFCDIIEFLEKKIAALQNFSQKRPQLCRHNWYLHLTKLPNLLLNYCLIDLIEKDLYLLVDVIQLVQIHMVSCLS